MQRKLDAQCMCAYLMAYLAHEVKQKYLQSYIIFFRSVSSNRELFDS